MTLRCGVDEAGRGPVIGPMVMGCCVLDDEGIRILKAEGVRDSKRIAPDRRLALEALIKETAIEYKLSIIQPAEIDLQRKNISLNLLEAQKTAQMIISLECTPEQVIVDAADAVAENYRERIINHINSMYPEFRSPRIIAEHKADDNYIEVGAASIIAKVERDRIVDELKKDHGDFGSGYPSDEKTMKFVRQMLRDGQMYDFVRRSWNTIDKAKQTKLGEFFQS